MVVIDSPAGGGELFSLVAGGVDRALILLTPDFQSLRNGDTIDRRLVELGVNRRSFVVNRVVQELWGSDAVPGLEQMTRTMRCRFAGILSEDPEVHVGNNTGVPCASDHNSYLYTVFRNIALSADR